MVMGRASMPRREGFTGERLIVIPGPQSAAMAADPLTADVHPTDAGHFPSARGHFVRRERGSPQVILLYCTAGLGWLKVAGRRVTMGSGTVAMVPPGTPHEYGADPVRPWTIYWLHATGRRTAGLCDRFLAREGGNIRSVGDDGELRRLFETLLSVLGAPLGPDDLLAACGVTTHLLTRALTLRRVDGADDDSVARRLDDVVEHLRDRVRARVTVGELAALARLSRSHFICLFRARFGRPPLDYFAHLKMREAARLLASTDLPMKQVAAAAGFQDPLYFSRAFRRVFGMPPTAYRRGPGRGQGVRRSSTPDPSGAGGDTATRATGRR